MWNFTFTCCNQKSPVYNNSVKREVEFKKIKDELKSFYIGKTKDEYYEHIVRLTRLFPTECLIIRENVCLFTKDS